MARNGKEDGKWEKKKSLLLTTRCVAKIVEEHVHRTQFLPHYLLLHILFFLYFVLDCGHTHTLTQRRPQRKWLYIQRVRIRIDFFFHEQSFAQRWKSDIKRNDVTKIFTQYVFVYGSLDRRSLHSIRKYFRTHCFIFDKSCCRISTGHHSMRKEYGTKQNQWPQKIGELDLFFFSNGFFLLLFTIIKTWQKTRWLNGLMGVDQIARNNYVCST